MSEEKLQCLEQIKQHLEAEADRMSGKFLLADLEPPATADKTQKNEENKEEEEVKEEVKLNIPTEAVPAGSAVNILEKPPTNIFNTPTAEAASSSKVSENIFMQPRTDKNFVNVFYNKASVNLFALKQKEQPQQLVNIFESAKMGPPSVVDDPEDGSSDVSQQALNEPSEKIMRFTYEQQWNKLGEWRAAKFRAGVGAVKENVLVSLEKEANKNDRVLYLVVRSEATKVILFHGFMLPGVRLDRFMGKQQNLKLTVLRQKHLKQEDNSEEVNEGGKKEEEKKMGEECEREQVKIQFEKEEDAVSFEQLITEFNKEK